MENCGQFYPRRSHKSLLPSTRNERILSILHSIPTLPLHAHRHGVLTHGHTLRISTSAYASHSVFLPWSFGSLHRRGLLCHCESVSRGGGATGVGHEQVRVCSRLHIVSLGTARPGRRLKVQLSVTGLLVPATVILKQNLIGSSA